MKSSREGLTVPRISSSAAAVALDPSGLQRRKSAATPAAAESASSLDRVIHERIRLGIVSALAANEHVTFNDLKKLLDTTDGNLSVHARKLEEAGYVQCSKSFEGRMPKTEYRLTEDGRKALTRYLDHMEALIQAARGGIL
jgi:DNA-binding transcriptional ArsR family regulator